MLTNRADLPGVIVALDFPDESEALALAERLGGLDVMFKVGLEAYSAGFGASLTRSLSGRGLPVFVDLKLLDIPATVERAAARTRECGATYLTVHAQRDALEAAVSGAGDTGILAVTLLTSVGAEELREGGTAASVEEHVVGRSALAAETGCAGVVCSPREAAAVRRAAGSGLRIVTPGIRPAGSGGDDQARTAGVAEAFAAGADHIVVGRPIRDAADPRKAAEGIVAEAAAT